MAKQAEQRLTSLRHDTVANDMAAIFAAPSARVRRISTVRPFRRSALERQALKVRSAAILGALACAAAILAAFLLAPVSPRSFPGGKREYRTQVIAPRLIPSPPLTTPADARAMHIKPMGPGRSHEERKLRTGHSGTNEHPADHVSAAANKVDRTDEFEHSSDQPALALPTATAPRCDELSSGQERAWCLHPDVLAAHQRLARTYVQATRDEIDASALRRLQRRWTNLQRLADEKPDDTIRGYEVIRQELQELIDDRQRARGL